MRSLILALTAVIAFGLACPVRAQDFKADPEVIALFVADQSVRQSSIDVSVQIEADDAARRTAMRRLLDAGRLQTSDDYYLAAFVFQHGRGDECLLAHVLAVTALAKGRSDAGPIAAATLDRYLQDTGRQQVYGTQFMIPFGDSPGTQAPYASDFMPDTVRQANGVPTRAEQLEQLSYYEGLKQTEKRH